MFQKDKSNMRAEMDMHIGPSSGPMRRDSGLPQMGKTRTAAVRVAPWLYGVQTHVAEVENASAWTYGPQQMLEFSSE